MNCPLCDAELLDQGPWGFLASHQSGDVLGRTYKCPNSDGFEDEDIANAFLERTNQTMADLGVEIWEEVTCDSSMHSVSGSFYTDQQGNLHPGYPC